MKKSFIFFFKICCLALTSSPIINTHGQVGYINTPSALTLGSPAYAFGAIRNEPDRKVFLTASPYDWLDATLFYVDITGKEYIYWNVGPGPSNQSYKDKGFNLKTSFELQNNLFIGVGANDIAGTGYYNSEYIVLTKLYNNFEVSAGVGLGNYANGISINNPLAAINSSFDQRQNYASDQGGTINFSNLFSGQSAALFFGGSYNFSKNKKIIFEYDPTSTNKKINYPATKSKFNIGYELNHDNFDFKISLIRGNEVNLQINFSDNFSLYNPRPFNSSREVNNLTDLRQALSENTIRLISLRENENEVEIHVAQNVFQNQYKPNETIKVLSKKIVKDRDLVITHEYLGMEVLKTYNKGSSTNVRNEIYADEDIDGVSAFQANQKFPVIINRTSPQVRNFLASREGFYYGALLIENDIEAVLSENLILISNLKYSLINNFDELYIPPLDTYPNQVRSDIKKYLNNFDDGIIIGRLELSKFSSYGKSHFFKSTFGIFEEMFGGAGFEYLYHPQGSIFSIGTEAYFVKKRDYDLKFNFLDYQNTFFRLNAQLIEPQTNTHFRVSYGEYLAGDIGYTFEAARRFDNGIEFSAFFTRTNVTKEQYGEGSYDKGITMKIPFNLFGNSKNLSKVTWRPLTKDPGALLIKSLNMQEQLNRYRVY